ncbi:hypothetical protein LshimejAT787_1001320 [Lyophyllum shimeji]|uniref:Uncharacterized protein n=1 Tax=Lyophyllum shimeji TaxID=47721 RepID=A0A9P3UQR7_LYOSH|nr:hypothetical protein LshimejAT787_1001320 [Lyophyllum shimeji]
MLPLSTGHRRDRPKGLWKARVMAMPARNLHERQPAGPPSESDTDDDDASTSTADIQRCSSSLDSLSDDEEIYYWDYSRRCSPYPDRESNWATSRKVMDTSTTAGPGTLPTQESCDYEDWEDLKELFAKAADQYENTEASEALPILRGVIHECHRFLLAYEDPSELFFNPPQINTQTSQYDDTAPSMLLAAAAPKERKCKCVELPTAFHVILGTTLFLFGNLIAHEPSLALEGEPDNPVPYWLAALDVFETGESLPSRTSGLCSDMPEDWRMAIVWGRTLVCLADEAVTRALKEANNRNGDSHPAPLWDDDPEWPPESPFAAIAARRPPVSRRISLTTTTPQELMVLAMDQFSRGIFHMPHPRHNTHSKAAQDQPHPPTVAAGAAAVVPPIGGPESSFSRAKELFTIASEVLLLAEKMPVPAERQQWAGWADSVFNQMKMEADMDAWRGPINSARGRCWLVVGSARIEEIEAAIERGDINLAASEEAQEAREGLAMAVEFFERAKGSASGVSTDEQEDRELKALLAEALLTFGNLTPDETKREELYARAQVEGGEDYLMEEDDDDDDGDEIMHDG